MFLGSVLAPQRNRRIDEYRGGTVRGRIRVVLEAMAAIRTEIGDALPITLRIFGYERIAGGRPMYNTELYEKLVAAMPNADVVAAGDCTGAGLIRNATEDGARVACTI
ncbi:hypothetical protein [Mycolicibacterium agri]|nr:hypothetical protein [Mycolicibacterium agri]